MEADIDSGFVTLGTHTIAVEQNGTLAYVQTSRLSYYDARFHVAQTLAHLRMLERAQMRAMAVVSAYEKWCSGPCGETRPRSYFSPDARNKDGLDGHCKQCRNEHRRKLYALEREAQGLTVRPYNRKQATVIEVDFTPIRKAA